MRRSNALTGFLAFVVACFILSASIALPILVRPFYYLHIETLRLTETTGWDRDVIVKAYDEMLDFCIGLDEDFSVGTLKWSEDGKSHFEDVKGLFLFDLWTAGISGMLLLTWLFLRKRSKVQPIRVLGRGYAFWGSVGLCSVFLFIGGLAALDFDRAFYVFHALFFPGKDNWIFDARTDEIIRVLPQVFFRNCAIAILICILLLSLGCVLWDLREKE